MRYTKEMIYFGMLCIQIHMWCFVSNVIIQYDCSEKIGSFNYYNLGFKRKEFTKDCDRKQI